MSKNINFGSEARNKLVKGIDTLADAVVSTLGPNGRNVVIEKDGEVPQSTKDFSDINEFLKEYKIISNQIKEYTDGIRSTI